MGSTCGARATGTFGRRRRTNNATAATRSSNAMPPPMQPATNGTLLSLGELQRQHLDVLRERPGERPQLRHLGTTHGA